MIEILIFVALLIYAYINDKEMFNRTIFAIVISAIGIFLFYITGSTKFLYGIIIGFVLFVIFALGGGFDN